MRRWQLGWAMAMGLGWWAPACFLPGIEPAGLGGSSGGANGGSGGSGAGATGGVAPVACNSVEECPPSPCNEVQCSEGFCVYTPMPGGLSPEQVAGDCLVTVCNDMGEYADVPDPNDLPAEPPPPCNTWSCATGALTEVPVTNCVNCCGAVERGDPTLDCTDGQCVGCNSPISCGPGGDCYTWTCSAGACQQVAAAPGAPCGAGSVCIESQAPFVDAESVSTCSGTNCVAKIGACGDFTCDRNGTACHTACTVADAATTCQLGASCSGGICADCTTCEEIPAAGYDNNVCPPSLTLRNQLATCFCQGNAPACQTPCANLCNLMFPALSQDCLNCLASNFGCQPEAVACQGDDDPI